MAQEKTYNMNGTVHVAGQSVSVDNMRIDAYSSKQAKLKLAFQIQRMLPRRVEIRTIMKAINKGVSVS